jgi:hypothetical protein
MARFEEDAISNAIVETEREIAGAAWGEEDTELDASGDRSLEDMGEGLEGQHEPEDAEDPEADEAEGEDESEEEAEPVVAAKPEPGKDGKGEQQPGKPEAHVPSGKLREANEAKRVAEAERDALKAELAKAGDTRSLADKLDMALREIAALKSAPRTEPKAADPPKAEVVPDMFEDPDGFVSNLRKGFQTELSKVVDVVRQQGVATSFQLAHVKHGDAFPAAMEALQQLNASNPEEKAIVQRIYNSSNPGESAVSWYKRNQTLARVGDDPAKFEEGIRKAEREALMKDPEFRKQLLAEMRGDAARGEDGQPRTITRLPKSLNGVSGSNLGADRASAHDGSDQAVADSAWR